MRKTKTFSYQLKDEAWFRRNAREARKTGRTESQQLIFIVRDYFKREAMLKAIGRESQAPANVAADEGSEDGGPG